MRRKVVVEEHPRGPAIITEIIDSECLHIGVLISRDQIRRLIQSGWRVMRKMPTEAASRKRARSGCFLRQLSDAEITVAISEHSESVNSTPKMQSGGSEEKENEKTTKKTE